ncbi:MAG: SIR2 family protein [Bacteroidetes bacterium]|nr:SIR2 family protein [Bacteroidota bacterium]
MIQEHLEKLKSTLLHDSPILFLGAGFSLGGKTKSGRDIPKANELKEIILTEFLKLSKSSSEYGELTNYPLSQVCQYCSNKQSPHYLIDFLTDFFSNTRPAPFHTKLTSYYWKKIYSTNIDDLVEKVFEHNQKDLVVQQYVRKFTHKKDSATEYYKLHGSVNNPSEGYVFSTDEYVDSMVHSKDFRFSSLSSDMHSENFIFVGSNFDEINLDYYLRLYENTGYASTRGKLYFINPAPSILLKSKIERVQGILLEWTTEQFLEFLESFSSTKTSISKYDLEKDITKLGYINIDFIKDSFKNTQNYDSQLYLGYEPCWEDIFAEWDFIDNRITQQLNKFLKTSANQKSAVLSIYGKPYIGKSVFIRRIGNELRKEGYETYHFEGRNFNYYPFLQFMRNSNNFNFAIVMDNASYYYGPLKQLMKLIPNGKKLIVVTSSRPFFHFKWRYNFVGEFFFEYLIDPTISSEYAKNIVLRLEEKGYLGELKNLKTVEERVSVVTSNNDLMSLLFSLTFGKGFIKRLNKDLQPHLEKDDSTRDLLLSLAIFNKIELPHFPIELVSHLTNGRAKEYMKKVDAFTKTTSQNSLQLRSGFFTTNIFRSVAKKKIILMVEDMLVVIASQVDDKNHSYWNEIHASLTKEKTLRKVLSLNSHEIKQLLYRIRNYYSDNFNFWIQLGIAEQREKDFEKALNHFKQAEALRPTSYMVQNAIGRNFLKQANSLDNIVIAKKYFQEGEKILINLIENREEFQARAFSTHCYLYEKILFVEKFHIQLTNDEIVKMGEYLKRITDKDENDIMAKHINNVFIRFLKKTNKLNLIKLNFQDLSKLKALFTEYNVSFDELLDDIEQE